MAISDLHIEREQYTPLIHFIREEGRLVIEGKSISEDPFTFYAPLFDWTKEFVENPFDLTIDFYLEYFNTASSKMIYDFVQDIFEADIKPTFTWKYLEEDEDLEEYGEYLKEMVGDNLKLIAIED